MKREMLVGCGRGSVGVAFHGIRLLSANKFIIAKKN